MTNYKNHIFSSKSYPNYEFRYVIRYSYNNSDPNMLQLYTSTEDENLVKEFILSNASDDSLTILNITNYSKEEDEYISNFIESL
jgi:hypothetical protein